MASRNNLPLVMMGALGGVAASIGLGFGLGQYTISGINPFYYTQPAATADYAPELVDQATVPTLYDPSATTG